MTKKETYIRKPEWLKIKLNTNKSYTGLKKLMRDNNLNTVCEEARCPNIHECWSERKTATFMILGDTCTRGCRFCAVKTGLPNELDWDEPERVADSVAIMGLKHTVITAVARDDVKDGGAAVFAETVRAIRRKNPVSTIEILPSDMKGDYESLHTLMDSEPDIFNHNIETVRRLTKRVRARAMYDRSLELLKRVKEIAPQTPTKSSIMVGLGETRSEEHTSELQSRGHLVCRLLLEKKTKQIILSNKCQQRCFSIRINLVGTTVCGTKHLIWQ